MPDDNKLLTKANELSRNADQMSAVIFAALLISDAIRTAGNAIAKALTEKK